MRAGSGKAKRFQGRCAISVTFEVKWSATTRCIIIAHHALMYLSQRRHLVRVEDEIGRLAVQVVLLVPENFCDALRDVRDDGLGSACCWWEGATLAPRASKPPAHDTYVCVRGMHEETAQA